MVTHKISYEDGSGFYGVFSQENVERVNPYEYFKNYENEKQAILLRDYISITYPALALFLSWESYLKQTEETVEGYFEKFEQIEIHPNLTRLLITTRKKDQLSLLKGIYLTTYVLNALILKSFKDYGYLFSKYSFKNYPKALKDLQRPRLLELNNNNTVFKKIGATNLTEGQLKNLILLRRVIVYNFLKKKMFGIASLLPMKALLAGKITKMDSLIFITYPVVLE